MLSHYFKQILRSLWRHKSFSLINFLGLSISIAAVVIIFLIAHYEKSFDSIHSNIENVYRVVSKNIQGDNEEYSAKVPYPTGKFIREELAGVPVSQIHYSRNMNLRIGKERPFKENNIVFADSLFFHVLDFSSIQNFWLQGNPATVLNEPNKAVITESTARRYFGSENPIGKLINLENKTDVEVVGVVKDISSGNHLPFSMIVSYATLNKDLMSGLDINSWGFTGSGYSYARLKGESSVAAAEQALKDIVLKNAETEKDKKKELYLQPLPQIHFDPTYEDTNPTYTVSISYLRMLLLLGTFIILIACVNYINISTSFAFSKSKEVGIRKTIGATKRQMFFHYMLEALMVVSFSTLIGILIAVIVLPGINQILVKSVIATPLLSWNFIVGTLAAIFLVTFISGAYPAFILSGFTPITSLKNQLPMPGKFSTVIRKGLVVFQFTTSIALIICTIVIARQMQFFQSKELGFNKDAVVEVELPVEDSAKIEHFRSLLQNLTGIQSVSFCLGAPISDNGLGVGLQAPELSESVEYTTRVIPCDAEYLKTYEMRLLAGRGFHPSEEKNRGTAVVVNRTLAKTLGYNNPADVLGKTIQLGLDDMKPTIVGVIEDFHTSSLHENINPVALTPFPYFYYAAGIKITPSSLQNTLTNIESAWRKVYPADVFQLKFIDETLARHYEQEQKDFNLFKAFAFISILICCMGLWGLIAFVVVRKTKEIGIRKVLGATVNGIVLLLSRDFLLLVLIALLFASPLAWYFMNKWLEDFAYRTDISWWIFLLGGISAMAIAFFTISFQAIKAALANPVKNLRTE